MNFQEFNLVIANPCSQDWNSMRPTETGRHCLSCRKTVLDFSSMTDENIKAFFIENAGKSICGRFKKEQLERIRIYLPANLFTRRMAVWKKFLAILLICFGSILFSVDVVWGNSPFQSEQTQQSQNEKKKNKSQKKYKHKNKKDIYLSWEITGTISDTLIQAGETMGLTIMDPTYPIATPFNCILPDVVAVMEKNKDQKVDPAIVSADLDLSNKRKDDVPKKENSPKNIEFILPAPLALRMRRKPAK